MSQLILGHQLRVEGFLAARWLEEWPKAFEQMADWISEVTNTQNVIIPTYIDLHVPFKKSCKNSITPCIYNIIIAMHVLCKSGCLCMDGSYTLCASLILTHNQIEFVIRENSNMKKLSLWDLTMRLMLSLDCSLEQTPGRQLSRFEKLKCGIDSVTLIHYI